MICWITHCLSSKASSNTVNPHKWKILCLIWNNIHFERESLRILFWCRRKYWAYSKTKSAYEWWFWKLWPQSRSCVRKNYKMFRKQKKESPQKQLTPKQVAYDKPSTQYIARNNLISSENGNESFCISIGFWNVAFFMNFAQFYPNVPDIWWKHRLTRNANRYALFNRFRH